MADTIAQESLKRDFTVRSTEAGEVQGVCAGEFCTYYGVPYAAPPVGANRFREPQPAVPWEGVRDATRPGATARYKIPDFPGLDIVPLIDTGQNGGDDFLTVNIWSPKDAEKRPVMVWVHGGAFVRGASSLSTVMSGFAGLPFGVFAAYD